MQPQTRGCCSCFDFMATNNQQQSTITRDGCGNYCNTQPPPPYSSVPGVVPLYSATSPGAPPAYDDVVDPEGDSSILLFYFFFFVFLQIFYFNPYRDTYTIYFIHNQ